MMEFNENNKNYSDVDDRNLYTATLVNDIDIFYVYRFSQSVLFESQV